MSVEQVDAQFKLVEQIHDLRAEIERLRASLKILWGILDQPPPEWKIIDDARKEVARALKEKP